MGNFVESFFEFHIEGIYAFTLCCVKDFIHFFYVQKELQNCRASLSKTKLSFIKLCFNDWIQVLENDSFKSFGHVCEQANRLVLTFIGFVILLIDGCHFDNFLLGWERSFVGSRLKDKEKRF